MSTRGGNEEGKFRIDKTNNVRKPHTPETTCERA